LDAIAFLMVWLDDSISSAIMAFSPLFRTSKTGTDSSLATTMGGALWKDGCHPLSDPRWSRAWKKCILAFERDDSEMVCQVSLRLEEDLIASGRALSRTLRHFHEFVPLVIAWK
jgi:hypothetical protein